MEIETAGNETIVSDTPVSQPLVCLACGPLR